MSRQGILRIHAEVQQRLQAQRILEEEAKRFQEAEAKREAEAYNIADIKAQIEANRKAAESVLLRQEAEKQEAEAKRIKQEAEAERLKQETETLDSTKILEEIGQNWGFIGLQAYKILNNIDTEDSHIFTYCHNIARHYESSFTIHDTGWGWLGDLVVISKETASNIYNTVYPTSQTDTGLYEQNTTQNGMLFETCSNFPFFSSQTID